MSYKQLMKKYIWLLFCSIITMLVSGYVYINHYFSFIMLIGVTCSIGSTIELISLIITTHKGNNIVVQLSRQKSKLFIMN